MPAPLVLLGKEPAHPPRASGAAPPGAAPRAPPVANVDIGATAASPWRLSAGGAAAGQSVVLLCELSAAAQAPGMHSRAAPRRAPE